MAQCRCGVVIGSQSSVTLDPSLVQPTQMVECTITATDGGGETASSTSSVMIGNSAPEIIGVTITPSASVTSSSTLVCSAVYFDPDNESLSPSYEWSSSGTVLGSGDTLVLTPATVQPNAIVECAVTVQDGFGASSTESAMVTVGNSAPTISDITITPDPANNDSTLTCAIVTSDADGGTPTESFAWSNASTGVSLGSGATLTLSSALASRTDEIQCTGTNRQHR